jgi:hypothetical protein
VAAGTEHRWEGRGQAAASARRRRRAAAPLLAKAGLMHAHGDAVEPFLPGATAAFQAQFSREPTVAESTVWLRQVTSLFGIGLAPQEGEGAEPDSD